MVKEARAEMRFGLQNGLSGGVIPSMLTSWCPYCSISPLLSLILLLGRTPWKERTEQGWRHGGERMEQGWCAVEGRRAAARTTAVDVASPERSSLQR